MKHAYITTEQIPGIENMPNVRDHDASVYLKLQGDALHIGGYENNPVFLDRVSKGAATPSITILSILTQIYKFQSANLLISKPPGSNLFNLARSNPLGHLVSLSCRLLAS
jgi:hypothetical protein